MKKDGFIPRPLLSKVVRLAAAIFKALPRLVIADCQMLNFDRYTTVQTITLNICYDRNYNPPERPQLAFGGFL